MAFQRPQGYQGYYAEKRLAAEERAYYKNEERLRQREIKRKERQRKREQKLREREREKERRRAFRKAEAARHRARKFRQRQAEKAKRKAKREAKRAAKLAAHKAAVAARRRERRMRHMQKMWDRLRVVRLEQPELWPQRWFTSPIFEARGALVTVYEDNYLDYCIYAAPLLHKMADVKWFAELFVGIEVQVGTWAAFLHFGIIDDERYQALTRTHVNQARMVRARTLRYLDFVWKMGMPIVNGKAGRRAQFRYRAICRRMGAMWSWDDRYTTAGLARFGSLIRLHPRIASRFAAASTFIERCERVGVYAGDRGEPRNRACPAAPGDHGHRPCIICALTFSTKTLRDGPERYRPGVDQESRGVQRLTSCCRFLLSDGPSQYQGSLRHWFKADVKREHDQGAKAGRKVNKREAGRGRRLLTEQEQRPGKFGGW